MGGEGPDALYPRNKVYAYIQTLNTFYLLFSFYEIQGSDSRCETFFTAGNTGPPRSLAVAVFMETVC